MTKSSVFSIQGAGWLSWWRAQTLLLKTESWDDLSMLISDWVIVSHSQRSISQSSMKDNQTTVIVFADFRALYDKNNLIIRTRHHSINTFSMHLDICIKNARGKASGGGRGGGKREREREREVTITVNSYSAWTRTKRTKARGGRKSEIHIAAVLTG